MTNTSKHTDAGATGRVPYTAGPHRYDPIDRVIYGSESQAYSESTRIARIESGNHADGHLYAAAPALLEACKDAAKQFEYMAGLFGSREPYPGAGSECLSRMRELLAAITLAEGGVA